MKEEDFNGNALENDDSAAKAMLEKGFPITYMNENDEMIKEYPNGRKEIITYDFKEDKRVILKVIDEGSTSEN